MKEGLVNIYEISSKYILSIKSEIERNKHLMEIIFNQLDKIKHLKLDNLSHEDINEIIIENGTLIKQSTNVIKDQSALVEKFKQWTSILRNIVDTFPYFPNIFTSDLIYRREYVTIKDLQELLVHYERDENYEYCAHIKRTIDYVKNLSAS